MGEVGDQCTVCFTGTLQLHEGMLVCDVCGSVFQVRLWGWAVPGCRAAPVT